MHDKPLGRDTGLTIIDDPGLYGGVHRAIKVRAGHYDERIAAAKLQNCLFDLLAGCGCHAASSAHTAG